METSELIIGIITGSIMVIGIISFILVKCWKTIISQKKNIEELINNGKKVKAEIIDYLLFEEYKYRKYKLYLYPVLQFFDENR